MADYLTEAEQIALLKRIWKEYGIPAIVGIVIAATIVFGWRYYNQYRAEKAEVASLIYAHLMVDELNNQTEDALKQATLLQEKYSSTPYATLSSLLVAQQDVSLKKYDDAQAQLQWVISHGVADAFKQVARIRSAKIYIQENQATKALTMLSSVKEPSYQGFISLVEGDAYVQLNQTDKAREAYQRALKLLPQSAAIQPLVQMKLESLPASKTDN